MASFSDQVSESYRNNPRKVLDVTVPLGTAPTDVEFIAKIKLVTTSIVEGWMGHSKNEIKITVLSGGLTNALYIVEDTLLSQKVIVRLFGVGTDLFIDRSIENEVFAYLSIHGMAPIFHGLFGNGRIEGFLHARNLIPNEFSHPKIAVGAARTMAKLHAQSITLSRESSIWSKTKHILTLLEDVRFQSPSQQLSMDSLDIHHLKECVIALQLELTAKKEDLMLKGSSRSELENGQYLALDISFTHNDLLSGNILIPLDYLENDGCDEMKFIDYEYAGYNARAFDLANHFCEYAGFDFDMDSDFPKNAQRRLFISTYLRDVGASDNEQFLDGFESVVLRYVLLSHLFWGTWAVLQASLSTIDFNFMDYAKKRIAGYHKHRIEFSKL